MVRPAEQTGDAPAGAHDRDPLSSDDWGRDHQTVRLVTMLARLRWTWHVGNADQLPARKGALIVVNARRFTFHQMLAALALSAVTDRPVRFAGRPQTVPMPAIALRLGGLIATPSEVAAALRDNQIVVVATAATFDPWKVGAVDYRLVEPAIRQRLPIHAAAVITAPLRRAARIEITRPLAVNRRRRGPLAEIEMANGIRRRLEGLIGEVGGARTGTPLDWIAPSGVGGG